MFSIDDGQARWYLNGAVFALAVMAPLIARRRAHALYFVFLAIGTFILTTKNTILHDIVYLLPQFKVLHSHAPNRELVAFFFAPAVLAGATVDAIIRRVKLSDLARSLLLAPILLLLGMAFYISRFDRVFDRWTVLAYCSVTLLCIFAIYIPNTVKRLHPVPAFVVSWLMPVVIIALILWQPNGHRIIDVARAGEWVPRYPASLSDLPCLVKREGAAKFLYGQDNDQFYRYFGHDSEVMRRRGEVQYRNNAYHQFTYTQPVQALLVGNQASCLGIYDIQGYNPVENKRMVEYMLALNDNVIQEYHASSVLTTGIGSQLLDALSARYIIIPLEIGPSRPDLFHLLQRYPQVYVDDDVRVLENPNAFPRSWIVHQAVEAGPGDAISVLTANRTVNLRTTAVLETTPPEMGEPSQPESDVATVVSMEPDRIRYDMTSASPGLLMLSEMYDPAWTAYVNGDEVAVQVADHALMAVPLPAGSAQVEIRYESRELTIGLAITSFTLISIFLLVGIEIATRRRPGLIDALKVRLPSPRHTRALTRAQDSSEP